jgi:hypothetical protein
VLVFDGSNSGRLSSALESSDRIAEVGDPGMPAGDGEALRGQRIHMRSMIGSSAYSESASSGENRGTKDEYPWTVVLQR